MSSSIDENVQRKLYFFYCVFFVAKTLCFSLVAALSVVSSFFLRFDALSIFS